MLIMSVPSPTSSSSRSTAVRCACSSLSSYLNKKRSLRISLGGFSSLTSSQKLKFRPLVCSVKAVAMAEVVEDKESVSRRRSETGLTGCSRTFLDVRTEEELLSGIKKEKDRGRLSRNVALLMEELYHNYRIAVLQSRIPNADHTILSNMAVLFDRILVDMEEPFTFSSHHTAIREPFDYYLFGQNYIRPLVDFRKSYIGNMSLFSDIEDKVRQGHNVVFISNHQSEADPAVIALLLETTNAYLSEKMTYIAGDRVITDPLCKPFSMGRNLICVYSKKHMHDAPELFELKKRANARSLKEMALLLRHGSQLIWIAPSGGRDRPDPQTGEWFPAPFDASSVDNMRRLAEHSGVPSHIYPMALLCHDIMPPPPQVEKQIGERRLIGFSGTGLSVAPEMLFQKISSEINNTDEAKDAFAIALYDSITDQYNVLNSAIHEDKGIDASNSSVVLSQPWKSRYT